MRAYRSSRRPGLAGEVRVARKDPGAVPPRLDRVQGQPAAHRRGRNGGDQAFGLGLPGQLGRAPTRNGYLPLRRRLAGHRLDLGDHGGGEAPRPTGAGAVRQTRQPLRAEPLAPARHHVDVHIQPAGDRGVGQATGGEQHDLGPDHMRVRSRVRAGLLFERCSIDLRQLDHERGSTGHRQPSDHRHPPRPGSSPRWGRNFHRCTYRRDY